MKQNKVTPPVTIKVMGRVPLFKIINRDIKNMFYMITALYTCL
jgi:hypothetical protein